MKPFMSYFLSNIIGNHRFHKKFRSISKIFKVTDISDLAKKAHDIYKKQNTSPKLYLFDLVKDNRSISKKFFTKHPYLDEKNSFFQKNYTSIKRSLFSRKWKGKFNLKRLEKVNDFIQFIRENDSFLNPDDVSYNVLRLSKNLTRQKYYSLSNKTCLLYTSPSPRDRG